MDSLKIGQIVNIHGIKGEVKVYPYTDDIDNLCNLKTIFLDSDLKLKYKVTRSRIQKNMIIFKLQNINSIEDTKPIMNKYIYIGKEKIEDENTYYIEDLINLDVYELSSIDDDIKNAKYFGKLTDVLKPGANDVYEIKSDKLTIYLPAIKQCIAKVDLEEKKIYVKIMEGLI